MNVKTMKIGSADYAKVVDRIKIFWEQNPQGKITTSHKIDTGYIIFTTEIIADQSKEFSKSATGSAMEKLNDKVKTFEKTESISVGRALALLGYLASGEIASSEEMEEFEDFKKTQKEEMLFEMQGKLDDIKTLDELKDFYKANEGLGKEFASMVTARKTELQNDNS